MGQERCRDHEGYIGARGGLWRVHGEWVYEDVKDCGKSAQCYTGGTELGRVHGCVQEV